MTKDCGIVSAMKLVSWNVNGIRSVAKKGFREFIKKERPDVLCVQETKMSQDAERLELSGYATYWNDAEKSGYAGTAVFTREKPVGVSMGMGRSKHDREGRLVTLEFKRFHLVNVYVPNSKRDLSRLDYRTREWDVDFLKFLKKLEKTKPVVFCGDLNVAHKPADLTYPEANIKNHGFTPEERAGLDRIVKAGFLDTFRQFHKTGGHYTWWSQFGNCRQRNIGWRIDYFCVSGSLKPRLKRAAILKNVMGSDHCPVSIDIRIP